MLKKFLRTLVCVLLIASMLTVTAFAETGTVTGRDVNLRSGPGTNYRVVTTVPYGASITVTDRSNDSWYGVSYNGKSGYMSAHYIDVAEESYSANIVTASGTAYVASDYVRFRSGPSSDNSIIATYNRGKEVTVTGTSGGWTACSIDGQNGYIYSDYLSYESPGFNASVQQDPYDYPATVETAPDGNGQLIVGEGGGESGNSGKKTGQSTGTAETPAPILNDPSIITQPSPAPRAEDPAPAPAVQVNGTLGYISSDFVSFRSGPSSSHSILGSYNKGKELTVTGTSGGWTACTIDGLNGYVYSQYVTTDVNSLFGGSGANAGTGSETIVTVTPAPQPTPSPTINGTKMGYITANNVRFRSGASTSSKVLSELFYGNSVVITGSSGLWTSIIYDGQVGFVYSDYVAVGSYKSGSSGGTATGRQIADYALQFVGYPYCWGGKSPATGFDCSGLMYYVYSQFGYTLNRVAADQARNGVHVDPDDLQPGDILCFYSSGDYIGHVGMYVGNNMFVHAATSATGVITEPVSGYYAARGFEARRII